MLTWRARDGRTARTSCVDGTELDDRADRRWRPRLSPPPPPPAGAATAARATRALRNRDAASFARPVINFDSDGGGSSSPGSTVFYYVCARLCLYICFCLWARTHTRPPARFVGVLDGLKTFFILFELFVFYRFCGVYYSAQVLTCFFFYPPPFVPR